MDNGNTPQLPNISEVDEAEVSAFLDSILLLVKALGYNFFQPLSVVPDNADSSAVIFELTKSRTLVHGKMKIQNGKYVLMKGSKLVKNEVPSASDWVKTNRKKLKDNGLYDESSDDTYTLNADTDFRSASGAARVCLKIAFRQMCTPICGRFGPDEGGVVGYVDRIRVKYTAKWSVQMAEMNFKTRSSVVMGGNTNGLRAWKYNGQTLAEYERST